MSSSDDTDRGGMGTTKKGVGELFVLVGRYRSFFPGVFAVQQLHFKTESIYKEFLEFIGTPLGTQFPSTYFVTERTNSNKLLLIIMQELKVLAETLIRAVLLAAIVGSILVNFVHVVP